MKIEQQPFRKYNIEKKVDSFTVRMNEEERKQLEEDKKIIQQSKDSTALKTLARIGSIVLHEEKISEIIRTIYKNKHFKSFTEGSTKFGGLRKENEQKENPITSKPNFFTIFYSQMICGAILTEFVFNLKGIGMVLMGAITFNDFPVVIAIIFCFFVMGLLVNLGNRVVCSKSHMIEDLTRKQSGKIAIMLSVLF